MSVTTEKKESSRNVKQSVTGDLCYVEVGMNGYGFIFI